MSRIVNHISEIRIASRKILDAVEDLRALKLESDARNWGTADYNNACTPDSGNGDVSGGDVNSVHTKTADMITWSEGGGQWLKALYKLKT